MSLPLRLTLLASLIPLATACVPVLIGGAATGGVAVAQERSVGSAVDDAGIKTRIWNKYLQSNTENLYAKVSIDVSEGRVLLTGATKDADSAARAVQMAWDVEGVKEVINEIQITEKSGTASSYAQDGWITTQARTRLIAEKNVRSINYTLETVNRVVYIMGIAQNQQELSQVLNVVSRVKGVQKVVSHVRLKDDPRRDAGVQASGQQGYTAPATQPQPAYADDYSGGYQDTGSGYDTTFQPQYDDSAYQNPAPIESRDLSAPSY